MTRGLGGGGGGEKERWQRRKHCQRRQRRNRGLEETVESRAAQRAQRREQPPVKGVSGKSWEDFVFCEELGVRVELHTAKVRVGRKGKRNKEPGWRKKRAVWTGEVTFTVVVPKGCRNEGGMRFPLSAP